MARNLRAEFSDRTKAEIFARDQALCCYTGMSLWLLDYGAAPAIGDSVDHVIVASQGGGNDADNGVLCNSYSNFSRNNGPRGFCLFHFALPCYDAFVMHGTIPSHVTDHYKRFRSLHYSDWYVNRAIIGIRFAAQPLEEHRRVDGKSLVRGREYHRKAALKRLDEWRAVVASKNPGSLADRGLLPLSRGPDHEILIEGLEATTLADVAATAKKLEPYLTASFDALNRLFDRPSEASLREHMERVERDPYVVERTKRGVVDHARWLLRSESAI